MSGRSIGSIIRPPPPPPPPPPTPIVPTRDDVIEGIVNVAIPSVASVGAPVVNKRTQRSITLDIEKIRGAGLLVPDARHSRIKEEYRHIKRPLLMNIDGKGAIKSEQSNLIVVTSAQPGEGKTFTACNLALSIASERNRTVLLVDADVVRPSVGKTLGFEVELGLVDFLIDDQLELADVLVNTSMPSLAVLPAGSKHHLSAELLAGDNMRRLTSEMSQRYPDRVIIFDAPPLLATTEAVILANLMGQVILVIEAERTSQSLVKEALALLSSNQMVGFVLNKARDGLVSDYGYQYAREDKEEDSSAVIG
ncbi:MAG: AAA family ATPase [Candidatus Competibacteraceae bacterium]|nr:AAA family ATPase [Candidatus Competibacteraceae bacterium]